MDESEKSNSGEDLIQDLPGWMPADEDTGNFKLIDVAGHAIDDVKKDIDGLDKAVRVQDSQTVEQLEELAKLVSTPSKQNEDLEKYRSRVTVQFQQLTNEGTIEELLNNVATILDSEIADLSYRKEGHGLVILSVPTENIQEISITETEFIEIAENLVAAGFDMTVLNYGSFTYTDPVQARTSNFEEEQGYDGLDDSGDPQGSGGTYSGIID